MELSDQIVCFEFYEFGWVRSLHDWIVSQVIEIGYA